METHRLAVRAILLAFVADNGTVECATHSTGSIVISAVIKGSAFGLNCGPRPSVNTRRFSKLTVLDARLYIGVGRIDEPA